MMQRLLITLPCLLILNATCLGQASRPNVLLFLVDDLGVNDIGVEGSTYYQTPHIDALAKSGIRFTQGYANCQVCSPSRASIQLGQFPARHGITDYIGARSGEEWKRGDRLLPAEYVRNLPAADITLAEALNEAGYQTFFAGKWHLGGDDSMPTDHGFNINVGGHFRGTPPGGFFAPYKNPWLEDGPDGESLTRRLGRETSAFIASHCEEDSAKPFFAMLSFYAVHAPVQTTPTLWKKYRETAPPAPDGGERFIIDRTLPVRQTQDNPVYAGMMETLDDAVGDVLTQLDASGQADNTIVIFT
ncbi:MAG: sulfatase-like hydrolase/transferase, partial [Planctomycetota bacterium]